MDTQIVKVSESIQQWDASLAEKKAELQHLAAEGEGMEITGVDDKAGYKAVDEYRKKVKNVRVALSKEAKSMRDPLTAINTFISSKEKELLAIITPGEDKAEKMLADIDSERAKIEEEKKEKERQRIQSRIDQLKHYGFELPIDDIMNASDDQFKEVLEEARLSYEKEQAEIAEAKRLQEEEEERQCIARAEEDARLKKEREELEAIRRQQEAQAAEIQRQKDELESELRRVESEKRAEEDRKRREEELKKAQEVAAENARLKAIEDQKEAERLRKEQEERAWIAQERKAARRPDKKKIESYIALIKAVPVPEMKTEEGVAVMTSIQELITRTETFTLEKTSAF